MRQIVRQNQFKKDLRLMQKQGKDLNKLIAVINDLAQDIALLPKFKDHALKGNYGDCRECHISPD